MSNDLKIDSAVIERIYCSWHEIIRSEKNLAKVFYNRLFDLNPELRVLFRGDMEEQGDKLMATLTFLLTKIHSGHTFIGDVQHLAKRHVEYGVSEEHYKVAGEVLIWSMREVLESDEDDEVFLLWEYVYNKIASVMIKASREGERRDDIYNVA